MKLISIFPSSSASFSGPGINSISELCLQKGLTISFSITKLSSRFCSQTGSEKYPQKIASCESSYP